mmetsp:Transcript_38773/g.28663  ORF Transcript_38773/g.28663 Transcript_38773/m.28663 type:complete len:82 (-) Transcript_38773:1472-1717(-)
MLLELANHYLELIRGLEAGNNEAELQCLYDEFYVICVINALFGIPCIHFIMLHWNYTGINTFEQDLKKFKEGFLDGNSLEV